MTKSTLHVNNLHINNETVDIVIIGGGIAGLWTLARLLKSGYQAILLESDSLGCVQTGASQGIIHGGTKYALTGKLTHSSQSIQQMPQRWKDCLDGFGEVDLSQAKKLSDYQYLWSNNSLTSKLTGFFASKVMSSRMQHLSSQQSVPPFDHSEFKGQLYQLDEPVLDIQSVIETIRQQFGQSIFQANIDNISKLNDLYQLKFSKQHLSINARRLILTAGAGNEKLLSSLNLKQPQMQKRPLLMPMLKADSSVLPELYAHCLGASALPKMTITSHQLVSDNQRIWYLGGEIAEQGVGRSIKDQVVAAKQEIKKLMPWMDFSVCQWSAIAVDRAEPKMPDGSRPVEPAVFQNQNVITAWPVKLAMVPTMVDKVMHELELTGIEKNLKQVFFPNLTSADTTKLPWEKIKNWI
jgi:glycine/D-amino acid oxidase-like deaminating enzyme